MIKLIMSDMDGTLLDENGELPAGFAGIVAQLRERGVQFAPSSGRQYYSLLDTFQDYKDEFIFIAENGTLVMRRGEELFSCPLAEHLAMQVVEEAKEIPGVYIAYAGKKFGYVLPEQNVQTFRDELAKYYTHTQVAEDFHADSINDTVIKVSIFDPTGHAGESIYPRLKKFSDRMQIVLASDYWVDAIDLFINKGIAVQQIQKKLHITPMESAAFGDFMNDAEMMSSVYYSYAMANAHPDLARLARYRAKSNAEHGVILAIQELIDRGMCGEPLPKA